MTARRRFRETGGVIVTPLYNYAIADPLRIG